MTNLDIVKMRVNEDFNDIRLENLQRIFPNWYEETLTVEPTDKEVLYNYNKKSMTEGVALKKPADKDEIAKQVVAFCEGDTTTGQTLVNDSGRIWH